MDQTLDNTVRPGSFMIYKLLRNSIQRFVLEVSRQNVYSFETLGTHLKRFYRQVNLTPEFGSKGLEFKRKQQQQS